MRVFKLKLFHKWAIKEGLTDDVLCQAIKEMASGLIDANLGGQVYKKRVSIRHRSKREGGRTIIAFKIEDKAFFIYGFAKNKRDNIEPHELNALKRLAKELLSYSDPKLSQAIEAGEIMEIPWNNQS